MPPGYNLILAVAAELAGDPPGDVQLVTSWYEGQLCPWLCPLPTAHRWNQRRGEGQEWRCCVDCEPIQWCENLRFEGWIILAPMPSFSSVLDVIGRSFLGNNGYIQKPGLYEFYVLVWDGLWAPVFLLGKAAFRNKTNKNKVSCNLPEQDPWEHVKVVMQILKNGLWWLDRSPWELARWLSSQLRHSDQSPRASIRMSQRPCEDLQLQSFVFQKKRTWRL